MKRFIGSIKGFMRFSINWIVTFNSRIELLKIFNCNISTIKSNYPIYTEPHKTFYGANEFAITDPDGYVLTFTEYKVGSIKGFMRFSINWIVTFNSRIELLKIFNCNI
jgi:chitinase